MRRPSTQSAVPSAATVGGRRREKEPARRGPPVASREEDDDRKHRHTQVPTGLGDAGVILARNATRFPPHERGSGRHDQIEEVDRIEPGLIGGTPAELRKHRDEQRAREHECEHAPGREREERAA